MHCPNMYVCKYINGLIPNYGRNVMLRIFAVIVLLVTTLQCYMHYQMMGYHGSILFYWLLCVGVSMLIWEQKPKGKI